MNLLSFEDAIEAILSVVPDLGEETIATQDSMGRVLTEDIVSDRDYPPFNRSAMDGFALSADDINGGQFPQFKIKETVLAGSTASSSLESGECYRIMTGAPVPASANAVIKIEECEVVGDNVTFSTKLPLSMWNNIAKQGEDSQANSVVINKGAIINHAVLGMLATIGKTHVNVRKLPQVGIVTTGDELKSIEQEVLPHQIHDSNKYVLGGLLSYLGLQPMFTALVPDDKQELTQAVQNALNCDIVLFTGGVSMGDADFVPEILAQAGIEKVFHKTAIKPGKPMWFGKGKQQLVFALPGNPFSCQVTFKLYVEIALRKLMGHEDLKWKSASLQQSRTKRSPLDEFFPVFVDGHKASIAAFNGSGDVTAGLLSQGIARQDSDRITIEAGEQIKFLDWKQA